MHEVANVVETGEQTDARERERVCAVASCLVTLISSTLDGATAAAPANTPNTPNTPNILNIFNTPTSPLLPQVCMWECEAFRERGGLCVQLPRQRPLRATAPSRHKRACARSSVQRALVLSRNLPFKEALVLPRNSPFQGALVLLRNSPFKEAL
eukprot:5649404-Pleurochrysis_carterae.AAC.3